VRTPLRRTSLTEIDTWAKASDKIADVDLLATYLNAWRDSADRVLSLCRDLTSGQWASRTDLPGWTVHDVVAHLAHVEIELAAGTLDTGASDRREMAPDATRAGVEQRPDREPDQLVAELADAVERRTAALAADPPSGPDDPPPGVSPGFGWDWQTLLRNRAIDMWVHEQDIRRAVDLPGGMDSPGAEVSVTSFAAALPYVLGKKVAPGLGTVVGWQVTGEVPVQLALQVGNDGRARTLDGEPPADATWLRMDTETFTILAAGRRAVDDVAFDVDGDHELATRVAAAMAVTP